MKNVYIVVCVILFVLVLYMYVSKNSHFTLTANIEKSEYYTADEIRGFSAQVKINVKVTVSGDDVYSFKVTRKHGTVVDISPEQIVSNPQQPVIFQIIQGEDTLVGTHTFTIDYSTYGDKTKFTRYATSYPITLASDQLSQSISSSTNANITQNNYNVPMSNQIKSTKNYVTITNGTTPIFAATNLFFQPYTTIPFDNSVTISGTRTGTSQEVFLYGTPIYVYPITGTTNQYLFSSHANANINTTPFLVFNSTNGTFDSVVLTFTNYPSAVMTIN